MNYEDDDDDDSPNMPKRLFTVSFDPLGGRQNYPNAYLPNPFPKG
jgi:hypothetical protein